MTILYLLLGLVLGAGFLLLSKLRKQADWVVVAVGLPVATAAYVGFALLCRDWRWAGYEAIGVAVYSLLAWCGLRFSSRWLILGWAIHPLWDTLLHLSGPAVGFAPRSYVFSCITFDLVVAAFVAAHPHKRDGVAV